MKRKSASKKLLPLMLILMLILGISMPANAAANPFTYNTAFFTDIPGLFTVTLQVNVFLAILAFTVAVPVFTAVIFPFDETFTTLLLEEDHFTAFFQFTTFN